MTDQPDQAAALRAIAAQAIDDVRTRTGLYDSALRTTESGLAVWLNRQDRRTAQLAEHLARHLNTCPDQGTVTP